jgi:hypothetical protein
MRGAADEDRCGLKQVFHLICDELRISKVPAVQAIGVAGWPAVAQVGHEIHGVNGAWLDGLFQPLHLQVRARRPESPNPTEIQATGCSCAR